MAKVTFVSSDRREFEAYPGVSLMEVAVENNIDGILAICGGVCSCATCHVYVEPSWYLKTGELSENEQLLLETLDEKTHTSRLACQIKLTDDLDGIVLHIPESQS